MTETQYSESLKNAIRIAASIAKEYRHNTFSGAHLLRALLSKDIGISDYLENLGKDVAYLREWADVRIENYKGFGKIEGEPTGDSSIFKIMEEAEVVQIKLSREELDPICCLAAICKPNVGFNSDQLKTFPLKQDEILADNIEQSQITTAVSASNGKNGVAPSRKPQTLFKYCVDKTSLGKEGKIDPILGRDKEVRMMTEILCRRSKPNVIIVGEPGVGKTALVEGFVLNMIDEKVPLNLKNAILFELDLGALVAGASYKGEVEERLKNIIKEVKAFEKAIIFIDEIHLLLDPSGPLGSGAANLLKPELARGELTVIGATTTDEYRRFIEKEEAFNRRFEVLKVEEPDIETTVRMLKKIIPLYEKHHQIEVAEDSILEAVYLAKRYIKDRRLPDAAIDLVDRTMASIKTMDETSKNEIQFLKNDLDQLIEVDKSESIQEIKWFFKQVENKISPILISQLQDDTDIEKFEVKPEFIKYCNDYLDKLGVLSNTKKGVVEKADIAAVVAYKTGIPLGKVQTKEKDKLLNIDNLLKKRVVGQDHAIKVLSETIVESRSGLMKAGQPIGSFFFLGPTGTGKTELAKSLAEFMFDDETALTRFDMSEFKEEHTVSNFLGAPAGYAGYGEGGPLVNAIREKPYSVVLFDEIEKAHPAVFDVFLQVLDEGKVSDRQGREGDFSNAIILFTSNIGSDKIIKSFNEGKLPVSQEMMEIMSGYFRPEFLARVTEIIPFAPITEENLVKIFDIHLGKLLKMSDKLGVEVEVSEKAKKQLAESEFNPKYGARPLAGVVRTQIRKPLSKRIVTGEAKSGSKLLIDVNKKGKIEWKSLKT